MAMDHHSASVYQIFLSSAFPQVIGVVLSRLLISRVLQFLKHYTDGNEVNIKLLTKKPSKTNYNLSGGFWDVVIPFINVF